MPGIYIRQFVCGLGKATNTLTSTLLQVTYQPIHITEMSYSTNASEAQKDAEKGQLTPQKIAMMSKRDRFRLMLRDYGATLFVFHITISLICLGSCYVVVIRSVVRSTELYESCAFLCLLDIYHNIYYHLSIKLRI